MLALKKDCHRVSVPAIGSSATSRAASRTKSRLFRNPFGIWLQGQGGQIGRFGPRIAAHDPHRSGLGTISQRSGVLVAIRISTYLTYWFPEQYRARIIAAFMVAIPASLAIGAPISTTVLQMGNVAGLKSWQWLFFIEGVPTILLGCIFLAIMPDRPRNADWLSAEERDWLQATIDREHKVVAALHGTNLLRAFADLRLLTLAFIYFVNTTANLGLAFFLPQILKGLGLSDMQTGLMTSVPYIVGTLGILGFGYVSDKYQERRWTLFAALALTGFGLVAAGLISGSLLAVAVMAIAAVGIYGMKAPFWPLPSMFLTGSAAAGGIALINSIGNLGGFVRPYVVGWMRDATHGYQMGLYFLGGLSLVAAALTPLVINAHFTRACDTAARGSAA